MVHHNVLPMVAIKNVFNTCIANKSQLQFLFGYSFYSVQYMGIEIKFSS